MADQSYIGKGKIYLGPYADNAKRRPVGNASALTLNITEEKKELLDFTAAGGGKANIVNRITAVELGMTLHDISPENLAVAAFGAASAVTAGGVTGEAHTAYKGGLVRLDFIPDPAQTLTVTGSGGTPTYVDGTDYVRVNAGIEILDGGSITDGLAIEVDYTKKAGNVVEALTQSGQEFKLTFAGLNEAQSGKEVVVDIHRVKFSPLQSLGLIADEFAGLELAGEALSDAAQTSGSKFFKVEMVD